MEAGDTRQDAYRHIIMNALLARHYPTISSKAPRMDFAKKIADWHEDCGCNEVDGKEMDYHNNAIGRQLFADNTSYETFLGATIGLNLPASGTLKHKAFELVETESCFIAKLNENDRIELNRVYYGFTIEETKAEILKTPVAKPVYIRKPIASSTYTYVFSHYDYSQCYEDGHVEPMRRSIKDPDNMIYCRERIEKREEIPACMVEKP